MQTHYKCGVGKNFLCLLKTLMLTKAEFIYVKYYYNLK